MDLREIKEESRKMLELFVNSIGIDGKWYSEINKTELVWGIPKGNGCGEFLSPKSKKLKEVLQTKRYNRETIKKLYEKGLILINQSYMEEETSPDFYVTVIHEILHANRNLLIFDNFRDGKNELAYVYNNGRVEQNTKKIFSKNADASQEILKGSIDTSKQTVDSYASKTSEEIEDIDWQEGKVITKMEKQQIVDEALVELMAILSYRLYSSKQRGRERDIWDVIKQEKDNYEGEDIGAMCEIILKHHDFELFNWMLDPITYSQGDIHYDFFEHYTKNDQDLLEKLYAAGAELSSFDSFEFFKGITTSNVKDVAESNTAIEQLSESFGDIKKAKNQEIKGKDKI